MVIIAVLAGGAGAWFLRPAIAPDPRIAAAARRADDAEKAASVQKDRADALEKSLDTTAKAKRDAEAKLTVAEAAQSELAGKTAAEADQRKAAQAVQAKLRAAIDRSIGAITIDGGEVHLLIADRVLWKPNDDALTDRGKAWLNKVAAVLKDLPDRLVWVQGHTDDQPRPVSAGPEAARDAPKPPVTPPAKKSAKPAATAPPPPAPVIRFPTNWELSAARALSVVRYFQDVAKLDPSRLAALAFGQYAPVSKTDQAANRRLEIVVGARRLPAR
ncbi:MAG TPA: OmpA family protein [Kofleriaceae bacterium]|nr:OmpA family protein [Kofleriaceae bacterium]